MINLGGWDLVVQGRFVKIARLDGEKFRFLDKPEPLLDDLRRSAARVDLFTFLQKLPNSSPKFPYPMEWDNLAVLPVSTFDHWWNEQIGFKARNKAKQAEKKGVILRQVPFDEALVQGIWEIYNETPIRQGRRFPHYGKDLERVRREEATFLDSSVFIGAFWHDKLIGFVKLLWDETRSQAGFLNIVSLVQHRDKAPTNALVARAVRFCAEEKIPYLVYSNFAYGKRKKDSLSDFKERNGFTKVDIPRYYVPLTGLGLAAFRLGLHRKFADRLPESVIIRLRQLRSAWYNRKFQSAAEAS